jgi:hypothetical protein
VDVGLLGSKVTQDQTKVKHFLKNYLHYDKKYRGRQEKFHAKALQQRKGRKEDAKTVRGTRIALRPLRRNPANPSIL